MNREHVREYIFYYIGCELLPGLVDSLFCIYQSDIEGFASESE